jgi:NADPH-dependent 2,4-dienoyl-CoA reductase/sulfur reductase-like enzyme
MARYNYLIIGGGMTADSAVRGIREIDKQGTIGIVGSEPDGPYDRPPLSKGLWKGKPLEKIRRNTASFGVDLHLGRWVKSLDADAKCAVDDIGERYLYDRLLLATGGSPRRLPFGGDDIIYYRTLQDYLRLRAATVAGERCVVIGGGFIGSELAAALAINGKQVTMVFLEQLIGELIYPKELARYVTEYYGDKGVTVLGGTSLLGLARHGDRLALGLRRAGGDDELTADVVVAGIGIRPNTELASSAGLAVDDGILVDEHLRSSQPAIYAAGDVARFYNPALGHRIRVEHEDNANTMGLIAGRSMAGAPVIYDHLPFFYSDLFDLGYEAVGELSSRLETFADWQEPYRKGVIYYLDGGRVHGVLLWNVWGQVDAARRLIAEPGPLRAEDLRGWITD